MTRAGHRVAVHAVDAMRFCMRPNIELHYPLTDANLFHGKKHPVEMGAKQIQEFLTHLAVKRNVAASTQN